jgi:ABC-2 type transport system permease protein
MNLRIVSALVWRYLFLYTRTPMRLVELVFWPMVDLLIWGFLTLSIQKHVEGPFANSITFLVGGMILWDVIFRAQQGVAVSFLEDVWTRNLLNIFVAPVRTLEYLGATFSVGFLRILFTVVIMSLVALFLVPFNILSLGLPLLGFFINLLLSGWALGMIATALILRWGQAAESLAWAVPFFIQPFCAIFYSISDMPGWAQPIARCLPASYVFEGMRQVMRGEGFSWSYFWTAVALNVALLSVAGIVSGKVLEITRKRGLLTKFATQ